MKYLICNLKANKDYQEMLIYKDELRSIKKSTTKLILAPSSIYLPLFKNENIALCNQDLSLNNSLHLTGDITISQLKSLNVKYVIIGHYDRRKYYNETQKDMISKIKTAIANGLKVIYCIGETKEELERKVEYQVLERELARILNYIPKEYFKNIIIAYEPTYLIGTESKHNLNKISESITFIKTLIKEYYDEKVTVVFGGNITPENVSKFKNIKNLDGFIIGHASLNPTNIKKIIDIL